MRKLLLLCFILFYSCHDKAKENDEKLKSTITTYLDDESFRRDLTFKPVEIRVIREEKTVLDTLFFKAMDNAYYKSYYSYTAVTPDYKNKPLPSFNHEVATDPTVARLDKLKRRYKGSELLTIVTAFVKGTETSRDNLTHNFILDSTQFVLDSKNTVIESTLNF
jgi:hypothetical protein